MTTESPRGVRERDVAGPGDGAGIEVVLVTGLSWIGL